MHKAHLFELVGICASFNGDKKIVKFFLTNAVDVQKYFIDQSPWYYGKNRATNNHLTLACMYGHKKIVHWLLEAGAPVTIESPYDICHIQRAAQEGYHDIVKMLLEHGAEIDHHSKILGSFNEDMEEPTALISAASHGHYAIVKILLEYGANKDTNFCGKNALKYAKRSGYTEIVELLKTHKYHMNDISIQSMNGELSVKGALEISSDC